MDEELYPEVSRNLEEFLSHTKTWFHPKDIWSEYNYRDEDFKHVLRQLLEEKVTGGELERGGQKYRVISRELREIDWFEADEQDYIKMSLPFDIHKQVKLFAGIVVIAGEKGKGKSSWIWDCIFRNLSPDRQQHLFVNDAQDVEIKERIMGFCEFYHRALPTPEEVVVYERFDKFGDVIVRDGINYVDYLDVNSDFYSIGQEIDDIHRATGKGVTFIALQKNPKEALGVGGIYSWKRSQVYITLAEPPDKLNELWQGQMTLKRTRGRMKKEVDPTGMKLCYDIKEGCKFTIEVGQ